MAVKPVLVPKGPQTRHVVLSGSRAKLRGLFVDSDIDTETLNVAGDVTVGAESYVQDNQGVLKLNGSSSKLGGDYPGVGLNVSHSAYVGDNLYVKSKLNVKGNTILEGPVQIKGDVEFPDDVTFKNVHVQESLTAKNGTVSDLSVTNKAKVLGDVEIAGNLWVKGTTTQVDTDNLVVKDNTIEVASGSLDGDGGGLLIRGADRYLTWSAAKERFNVGGDTYIDGKLTVKDGLEAKSGSFTGDVSASSFTGGTFTGSFEGDGSGLKNVHVDLNEVSTIREYIQIAPGSSTTVLNTFHNPSVLVSVFQFTDVSEEQSVQVYPEITLHNSEPQGVEIHNPSDTETFRGYVVIANAGHIVNQQVDWVKAETAKYNFSGSAGDRILIPHNLGTSNVIVTLYTFVPVDPEVVGGPQGFCQFVSERVWVKDENNVEILLPNDVEQGYAVIAKAGHVIHVITSGSIQEVARVVGTFINADGTKELTVEHDFNDTQVLVDVYRYPKDGGPKYLYTDKCKVEIVDSNTVRVSCPEATVEEPFDVDVVVGKAGHIIDASDLQLNQATLDRLGVHYDGREEPCLARSYYADERVSSEEVVAREYVDTLRVGTKETKPVGGYGDDGWGSFIEFKDGTIDSYIAPEQDVEPEIVARLDNVGNYSVAGEVYSQGVKTSSDINLKKDVETISGALESLEKLHGVKFKWTTTEDRGMGVIAQEVEKVYPELVSSIGFTKKHLTVDYNGLVAVLLEAVKELSHRVDVLEKEIEQK